MDAATVAAAAGEFWAEAATTAGRIMLPEFRGAKFIK